ncbi:2-C-methyl-D-erythritol 4-phosphate cytidylyltransferase, partial [Klebsiella pneumoniae]|nr:2-C-methyl-D-erythritol 4-phosphate cytidylyltransferase [Klebsiella pneumoniae]MCP6663503.1 2-C-methyl-D-erythritol 4-phosphate cytidylyltransferase [Klebsiella pneumoniae]
MGSAINKVLLPLAGKSVLAHTVQAVCQAEAVTSIVVTAAIEEVERTSEQLASLKLAVPWQVVPGGSERQYSIVNALKV